LRADRPELFDRRAAYSPLPVEGRGARCAVAFARADELIVVVPRLVLSRPPEWGEAHVTLPAGEWRNLFTGESVEGAVALGRLFVSFPVAVLVTEA
jgi:(1->4)-alpha-D-glucan 1-alpha-D-glucosylmutase